MIKLQKYTSLRAIILFLSITFIINAQPAPYHNGAELQMALNKLDVLGSVLYIAAHPDDENTSLMAYLVNELQVRAAYLSLTRGDGGQNLIGSEKGDLLGVLRTQELLAARRIDKGEQFFTRAVDFGYSKTAEETLRNWDRDSILYDMVKVIRQFRPDVIITRFDQNNGGHGHHLASAILAVEAFSAAADPNRFPDQLKKLKPWKTKRIFWNTWRPSDKAVSLEVGDYNPYLGLSYSEIAARARSMHKCQGFGVSPNRAGRTESFDLLAGNPVKKNIFEGIDFSWKRISNSTKIQQMIDEVRKNFDITSPSRSIPELVKIYKELGSVNDTFWANIKRKEVQEIIRMCSGLWMESVTNRPGTSPGKEIEVSSTIVNRSDANIKLVKIKTRFCADEKKSDKVLLNNIPETITSNCTIPDKIEYTQPYWLKEKGNGKMFAVPDPELIGKAENGSALITDFTINVNGIELTYEIPVLYRWNDAREGELFQPFVIRPLVSLKIQEPNYIYVDGETHSVEVELLAKESNVSGDLTLDLPKGWKSEPGQFAFSLMDANDKQIFSFNVTPSTSAVNGEAKVKAVISNKIFTNEIVEISYPHIPLQTVLKPSTTNFVKLNIKYKPSKIGYIMGSGDEIPELLLQLGYEVDLLSDDDLDVKDLSVYETIICGVRAFNVRERLATQQKRLIEYVQNGGTWIVQHNTRFGKRVDQIGPYTFEVQGRSRIAEEDSPIKIIDETHPLMNYPNKITQNDFEGWIQERGLYFADSWDKNFAPILSGHDQGESPKEGGLLYAKYAKGVFIFSGYSWFRELPAGVPGAYRIFINLISAHGE